MLQGHLRPCIFKYLCQMELTISGKPYLLTSSVCGFWYIDYCLGVVECSFR